MLSRYLSPIDAWAIAFGCMVGWGVFVMPGTTFLPVAGPAGSVASMIASTLIMLIIGRNYVYLMRRRPGTGGIYAYTREAFGRDHAFLSTWFLSLSYLSIVFLNATALFIISRTLAGDFWQFGFHYQVAGCDVYFGEILLSASVLVITGLLFVLGKSILQRLQTVLAIVLLGGLVLISAVTLPNIDPTVLTQFSDGEGAGPAWSILSLVLLAPWAFVGFDIISLETAHFNFPMRLSWRVVVISIVCSGLAYAAMSLVSVTFIPQGYDGWQSYIADLGALAGTASVPPFNAAESAIGETGVAVAAITAIAAILTGVIGGSRATVRMLSTMAEDRILSKGFLGTTRSVMFIMVISILISFLGRNALNWFVELTSFGAIVGFGYASADAYKLARSKGDRSTMVTGIAGLVISVAFAIVHLISRVGAIETMSAPSFLLLALWCLLGFVFYWRTLRETNSAEFKGISVSGTVLFSLLFYSVLMWFAKSLFGMAPDADMQVAIVRNAIVLVACVAVGLAGMLHIQRMLRDRQEQLERDVIHAEESSKAKSQFLFNMSHDIRTPLNAIIGYTRLAKMEPDVSPNVSEHIEKIEVSSEHLLALIDDILEMSQIESGKLELALEPTDLREVAREAGTLFEDQMRGKGVAFEVDASKIDDAVVMCDRNRLNRVVQNLLSNAYKFTSEGGTVKLTLWQIGRADSGRGEYELRVKDDGIGMSEEFAEKVFDAFERERTSTISGIKGTGLGMAITKNIIDLMGGTIEVDTAPGQGTEFVVRVAFDLVSEDGGSSAATAAATALEPVDFSRMRVLLVEDNEVNREIMTMLLANHGLKVDVATNGREAVDAIAASRPGSFDVVLMDIQMPVMDGYEATVAIRNLDNRELANVPIVAVTANAFGEDARKAFEVGMNGHVAKPVDPDKLMAVLTEVLSSSPKDIGA